MWESHYKVKDTGVVDDDCVRKKSPLAIVMWYMPIISRVKRLFANVNNAKNIDGMKMKENVMEIFFM